MFRTVNIAVIAHDVSIPLYKHRSKEFSERTFFLAKHFDEVHLISKETNIGSEDRLCIKDDFTSNIIIHRVPRSLIASNVEVLRIVRSVAADVIFADGIGHGASSLLCKKKYGIPLITFVQGYEADLKAIRLMLKLGMKPTPSLLSKIFAMYDLVVLRASDKVLCVSPGLVKYARGLLAKKDWNKIEFVPHALQYVRHIPKEAMRWADDIVGSFEASNERGFLLLMGVGIGLSKGTDIALKAYKCIVEKNPDAAIVLVSKAIDPKYERMAKKLGLRDNVLFLRKLPRDRVLALLSRASVFLHPSFSEGFSFAVAEAMALGVPVVAYSNKSLKAPVNQGAVIGIKTPDPKDYSEKCISLIEDEEQRRSLVEKAMAYITPYVEFSEEERLKLICRSIEEVLL